MGLFFKRNKNLKVLGWFGKVKKEREGRGESVTFLGYNGILNI